MAWMIPYNKLDTQQKDFVDNVDINQENVWIKGFPGCGKSVLLAHTIRKIRNVHPNAQIVVVVYTQALKAMFEASFREMEQQVRIMTYFEFMRDDEKYDYVLSDEVQDLTPSVLREMNKRSKHVIVAGDSNQSIFSCDPKSGENTVTPSEITDILKTRDFELGIIHRLSSSIIRAVEKFLPNMNIFKAKREPTKSTQIRLCKAHNKIEEVKYIMREAQKAIDVGESAVILLPTHKSIINFINIALVDAGKKQWQPFVNIYGGTDWSRLNSHLRLEKMPMQYVGNGYGNFSEEDKRITLMTYHSAKGLDFDNVFIPNLNNDLRIVQDEALSKTLFMVAMTRSRNNLYLTYYGDAHNYLDAFKDDCNYIDIHDSLCGVSGINTTKTSTTKTTNPFGI